MEKERFRASFFYGHANTFLGSFYSAEEAARAYDNAVRKAGGRVVNFPRPGTDEVQAVKGEKEEVTLRRAAGEQLPPRSIPLPPDPGYKGVSVDSKARTAAVFQVAVVCGGKTTYLGHFCTAEEAARAHDDAVRKAGRCVVNFPRPKSNEVQAVKGEKEELTLRRAAAEQAAGASGGITPHDLPAQSTKRRTFAPPPSEPSRKRAAASVETQAPAVIKTESPAAPSPARYTRRPPHRIDAAAWPPPAGEEEPSVDHAPTADIKTEASPSAAIKTESPTTPVVATPVVKTEVTTVDGSAAAPAL